MQNWLNNLERLLRQGRSAILATLVHRTGHSPDSTGTQLVISADQVFGKLNNAERLAEVVNHSREMLQRRLPWSTRAFALRPIVGHENGDCQFVFQLIDEQAAVRWLNDSQVAVAQNRPAVLICKAGESPALAIEAKQVDPALQPALQDLLTGADANAVTHLNEHLLIRLPGQPLRVAVAGNGAVAAALIRNLRLLPCRLVWLTSTTPIDSGVPLAALNAGSVDQLPDYSHLLIASNDHELDKRLCAHAIRHPSIGFIGCLGSEKKAALLRKALHEEGLGTVDTARIITPVGLADINGNHPSIIALSIIAQLLTRSVSGASLPVDSDRD